MKLTDFLYFCYRVYDRLAILFQKQYVSKFISTDSIPPHILGRVYVQTTNLKIGKNVTLYPNVYLWGNNIEIGNNVDIGIGTIIYSRKGVKIGSNTSIAGQCYIIDSNHKTESGKLIREQSMDTAADGIVIGNDVWIAAQCSVLKGAIIKDGAVIGAQSLVNSIIPENSIAVGTPAKVIKQRK